MAIKAFLKLLTGTSKIVQESSNIVKSYGTNVIENSVLKGEYVSREEYNQLKQLVIKIHKELETMKRQ